MLPYENLVADYIRTTGNHVLYRVTPIYDDTDLLCKGLLMEAQSIETEDMKFCVYCYNVQPGIIIDYATGNSYIGNSAEETDESVTEITYVLNTNSHKIHRPDCKSVQDIKPQNKQITDEDIDVLIQQGYSPCGSCHPEQ
jgi:DNA-entry nuclease